MAVNKTYCQKYNNTFCKQIYLISTNATIQRLIVYDVVGDVVTQKQNVTQIDVSNQLAANYFVQIETDKGTFTKPIVVVK